MGKSLVIVESPAKAKTINKYLGNDFIVKSSVGHIRDLPTSGSGNSDPKARAKEAAKTRKMSPDKKAAYQKEKARKQALKSPISISSSPNPRLAGHLILKRAKHIEITIPNNLQRTLHPVPSSKQADM